MNIDEKDVKGIKYLYHVKFLVIVLFQFAISMT